MKLQNSIFLKFFPFNFLIFHNRIDVKKFLLQFPKRSPFSFLKFCNRMDVQKISKGPLLLFLALIVRFFKRNNSCLKIRISQAQHAMTNFRFFLKTGDFSMRLFQISFHRSPPHFLQETKRFASVKDSSTFSTLCDLPKTIKKFSKNFENFFPQFSGFF